MELKFADVCEPKFCSILFANRFGKHWKYNKRLNSSDDYLLKPFKIPGTWRKSQRTFQTGRSIQKPNEIITIADLQINWNKIRNSEMEIFISLTAKE
jgi:hypothetical protein